MIEGLKLSIPKRLAFLRTALILTLLVSVLLSFRLWAGEREFPATPLLTGFELTAPLNWTLFIMLLLAWPMALLSKFPRLFLLLALLISVVLVTADINRIQPWFYIYSCMLLILLFYNGRVDNPNTYNAFFVVLQLILASVYFFNGFSMLYPNYTESSFSELIQPLHTWMSDRQFAFFVKAGHIAPYCLMITGLGLLLKSVRFLAIAIALIIHLLLFLLLFPGVDGFNYPLWFANLSFPVILLLLFSGDVSSRYFSPAFLLQKFVFYPVVILFFILPFFNRLELWPDFLSSNYRSGNTRAVKISLSEEAYIRLPEDLQTYCHRENFSYVLDYKTWCENELHADCFPDQRVFTGIYDYVLSRSGNQSDQISMDKLNSSKLLFKR